MFVQGESVSLAPAALVFIVLKLTGVISWSWAWVLSPLWIPAVFALSFAAVILFVFFVSFLIAAFVKPNNVSIGKTTKK